MKREKKCVNRSLYPKVVAAGLMAASLLSSTMIVRSGPPPCPECAPAEELGLGTATNCTVLQLAAAKVEIGGPVGGIFGDVCIAPGGKLSMSRDQFVTGTIRLGSGASFKNGSDWTVSVEQDADLSIEINDALAAAANAANLPCSTSITTLDGKTTTTITGGSGLNVICVHDVVLAGKQIFLAGPADAFFIFNVTGRFVLKGGGAGPQIRATGDVPPRNVLYNIIGPGEVVELIGGAGGENCCAAIVDGTLLAPQRKIALKPGKVNGNVISGKDISIHSGASVGCWPCVEWPPLPPVNVEWPPLPPAN